MKLVAMTLAGLIFLEACGGSMVQRRVPQSGGSVGAPQDSANGQQQQEKTAKSSAWPWVVGGVVAVAATVALVSLAAEGAGRAAGRGATNAAGTSASRSSGPVTVAGNL